MAAVTIPLQPSPYEGDVDKWRSDAIIQIEGVPTRWAARWSVGYVGPEGTARRVMGGPVLPGPYAYFYGLAGVIDNYGGSGAENARAEAEGRFFTVAPGDELDFNGATFRVELESGIADRGYPRLVRVN